MSRIHSSRVIPALLALFVTVLSAGPANADVAVAGPNLDPGHDALVAAWNLQFDVAEEYPYDDPETGSGTLVVDTFMDGEEFDVLIRDTPDAGDSCEIRAAMRNGTLFERISEDCDLEHYLDVLHVVFPDRVDPGIYELLTRGGPAEGDDDDDGQLPPFVDPGYGREDADDDSLCMAAQGDCAYYVIGGIGVAIGVGVALTPMAGIVIGVALEAAAAISCIGRLSAYCGEQDIDALIEELVGDWMFLFFDPQDFVDVEDLMDYLREYLGGQICQDGPRMGARRGVMVPLDVSAMLPADAPYADWTDVGVRFIP